MLIAIGGPLWDYFSQGGLMMWPLLACSILGVVFIVERVIAYYRIKGETAEIVSEVRESLLERQLRRAIEICEGFEHPVAITLKSGLLRFGKSHEEIEKAMPAVRGRPFRIPARSWGAGPRGEEPQARGGLAPEIESRGLPV